METSKKIMSSIKDKWDYIVSSEPKSLGLRMETNYSEVRHFKRMGQSKEFLKIMVMGEMGLGKSALCSKMAGVHLVERRYDEPKSDFGMLKQVATEECPFLDPPFVSNHGQNSVTKKTSFVLSHYLGKSDNHKIMLIDSPGFFDPDQSMLDHIKGKNVAKHKDDFIDDLTSKLEAVGSIHAILILISLGDGGRFTYTLQKTIEAISAMFDNNSQSISQNLFFAFSKCDRNREDDWIDDMEDRQKVYDGIFNRLLSKGVRLNPVDEPQLFFLSAKNPSENEISQSEEFKSLYMSICKTPPLMTEKLQDLRKYFKSK